MHHIKHHINHYITDLNEKALKHKGNNTSPLLELSSMHCNSHISTII